MRQVFPLLLILVLSRPALPETDRASWANLNALQPGQKIQVAGTTAKNQYGKFVSVSDTAMSYREMHAERMILKQDVRSVKLMENKHRLRNALIVGGVGVAVGAGIGAALHKPCPPQTLCFDIGGAALPAGIGAVLGGVGGAVAGTFWPSHPTIYQVSSH